MFPPSKDAGRAIYLDIPGQRTAAYVAMVRVQRDCENLFAHHVKEHSIPIAWRSPGGAMTPASSENNDPSLSDFLFFLCLLCGLQSNMVLAEDQEHGRHIFANVQSSLWTKGADETTSEQRGSPL